MFDSFRYLVRTGFAIIFANLCGFPIAEEKGYCSEINYNSEIGIVSPI